MPVDYHCITNHEILASEHNRQMSLNPLSSISYNNQLHGVEQGCPNFLHKGPVINKQKSRGAVRLGVSPVLVQF